MRFDVHPRYAIISIPTSGRGVDQYPAHKEVLVRMPQAQFDIVVEAPGWKRARVSVLANQLGPVWPAEGALHLKPDSFKATLEQLPRWPLLFLLVIPFLRKPRRAPENTSPPVEAPPQGLPWEFAPGVVIQGYEVLSRLGEGASGIVYKVRSCSAEEFALKLVKPQADSDGDLMARFRREMRMLSHLRHPNIPYLADVGEYRGMSYLVMELLQPTSLADRIRERPLPWPEGLGILTQIASALAFCHKQGILHRDIKPDNVVFDATGRFRLTDFGLARQSNSTTLTQEGSLLGTPMYMAPEIIEGQAADARSDQYSLGCLAYELFSGSTPYEGDNAISILMKHLEGNAPQLSEVPPTLALLVRRMMQRRPEDRFPDMDAVVAALRGIEG